MIDFLQAHPDGLILAMDQMSLYFQATLKRVWFAIGRHPPCASALTVTIYITMAHSIYEPVKN